MIKINVDWDQLIIAYYFAVPQHLDYKMVTQMGVNEFNLLHIWFLIAQYCYCISNVC